jgi:hypothetical protein
MGDLVVWQRDKEELVGKVMGFSFSSDNMVQVRVPHNSGDATDDKYINMSKLRLAVDSEIEEYDARLELEQLLQHTYKIPAKIRHTNLSGKDDVRFSEYAWEGFGIAGKGRGYTDALRNCKYFIENQEENARKFAKHLKVSGFEEVEWNGWEPNPIPDPDQWPVRGMFRVRFSHNSMITTDDWTAKQLLYLNQRNRLDEKQKDARIQELEALLAAAEAELQREIAA